MLPAINHPASPHRALGYESHLAPESIIFTLPPLFNRINFWPQLFDPIYFCLGRFCQRAPGAEHVRSKIMAAGDSRALNRRIELGSDPGSVFRLQIGVYGHIVVLVALQYRYK
jgi:hypothetical protein